MKKSRGLFASDYENTPIAPIRDTRTIKKKEKPKDEREFMGLFDDTGTPLSLFAQKKESVQGQFFNEKKRKKYAI